MMQKIGGETKGLVIHITFFWFSERRFKGPHRTITSKFNIYEEEQKILQTSSTPFHAVMLFCIPINHHAAMYVLYNLLDPDLELKRRHPDPTYIPHLLVQ